MVAQVAGVEPENASENRRNGSLVDAGPFADGVLVLQVLPHENRVNWLLGDAPDITAPMPSASLPDRLPVFVDPLARWLEACPPTNRIAFGMSPCSQLRIELRVTPGQATI